VLVDDPAAANAIFFGGDDGEELRRVLHDGVHWVQSGFAGNDHLFAAGIVDDSRLWTSARGAYANPIAEQVLGFILGAGRNLFAYSRARAWNKIESRTLEGSTAGVVGAGGIGRAVIERVNAFGARVLATPRSGADVPG